MLARMVGLVVIGTLFALPAQSQRPPGGVIYGRILNEAGEVIPMVDVALHTRSEKPPNSLGALRKLTRADADGNYIFTNVPSGDYFIVGHGLGLAYGQRITDPHSTYLNTYFPGVVELSEAYAVRISQGIVVSDIDFRLRRDERR